MTTTFLIMRIAELCLLFQACRYLRAIAGNQHVLARLLARLVGQRQAEKVLPSRVARHLPR